MNFEEKTLNSQVVFDGRVMTVKKDDVELFDGSTSFREIVVHPGGVVIAALNNDKIILVEQYRYPLKSVNLELPAGRLEIGEDPQEAAKRELEEETGYRTNSWQSLGYINTTPGICTEKLHLYLAKNLEFVGEHPDKGEFLKCLQYPVSEVFSMIKNGKINDGKTICTLTRAFCKGFEI
ncbi:NUDIX hydrolase [bacterium]|nr:NUDIX hydrolase [bacterium]